MTWPDGSSRFPRISAGFLSLCFAGRGSASRKWRPAPRASRATFTDAAVRTRGERRPSTSFPSPPIDPPSTAARAPPSRRPRARLPISPRDPSFVRPWTLFFREFFRARRSVASPPCHASADRRDARPIDPRRSSVTSSRCPPRHPPRCPPSGRAPTSTGTLTTPRSSPAPP